MRNDDNVNSVEFVNKATFYALSGLPLRNDDFWDRALAMRNAVTKYSYSLLDELAESRLAKKIGHLKTAMYTIITRAGQLGPDIRLVLVQRQDLQPVHINEVSAELGEKFKLILVELQVMFPTPDTASKHEMRKNITEHALTRAGGEFVALAMKLGASEDQSVALQADFEKLKPHVRDVVVAIGKNGLGHGCQCVDRPHHLS
jgi:hypothetical protein